MGEDDFGFCLTLHHIVTDAWSTGVLMRELSTLYAAFAAGEGSPLTAKIAKHWILVVQHQFRAQAAIELHLFFT